MLLPSAHLQQRKLDVHVENRTIYGLPNAEMNIYETHRQAERVELVFSSHVLASMIVGKKVMHLDTGSFDFFPGESVVLPPDEVMRIDFPEANISTPTQCLALAIAPDLINTTVDRLNDQHTCADEYRKWQFSDQNFHFTNDESINQVINRLVYLFVENHPSRQIFADFMLKELIIRLMQTEARHILINQAELNSHQSRLAFIVQFIRQHLHEPLKIEELSQKAYMSQTSFFRSFKTELGISPVDFINNERIKTAKAMLRMPSVSICQIATACGFNNVPYFNKMFKRATGLTPTEFKKMTNDE